MFFSWVKKYEFCVGVFSTCDDILIEFMVDNFIQIRSKYLYLAFNEKNQNFEFKVTAVKL